MRCQKCGNPNPDSYLYCVRCGAELQEITEDYLTDWYNYTVPDEPEKPVLPPVRKIGFWEAVKNFFTHYADFKGRATLREFWFAYLYVQLFQFVVSFLLVLLGMHLFPDPDRSTAFYQMGTVILALALAIPSISLYWRRLHDIGRSGAWYFLAFVPFGNFILLLWVGFYSSVGDNQYGPRKVADNSGISPDLYS